MRRLGLALLVLVVLGLFDWAGVPLPLPGSSAARPEKAQALSQYTPTGGTLAVGTNLSPITSAAASGNVGSWKGTLASDNFYWSASSTASGLDQQLSLDGAQLNNANKLIVTYEAGSNSATLQRQYQICDWSSSAGVDNAADANCTGGGWRTLNTRKLAIATAADTVYVWHLYDGFWSSPGNANVPLSTPVSNFINTSSGRVLVRAFSTTSCTTCSHSFDYLRVEPVIDSLYLPAGMTSLSGAVTGDYRSAENATFVSPTGSDNSYLQVTGTATTSADFYVTFQNIRTYAAMNAIVMRAEYSCSATGNTIRPKIWNFTTSSWEDLSASSIACSTTDATNAFAKDSIDVNDYVSNGQMRVGWRTLSVGSQAIRIDHMYVMLGAVNSDSAQCEISFGTGTASDCANTRTLDTTLASPSTWQQTAEAESATFGHDYYAQDNDADANTGEYAASANVWIDSAIPGNAQVVARLYGINWRSNSATITTQGQFRDFNGSNPTISGGWTSFGGANALTTYSYMDPVTNGYFGGNPEDYVDAYSGAVNIRVRTSASTNVTGGVTRDIDFLFTSLQWVEAPSVGTITLTMNAGSVPLGSVGSVTPVLATSTAVVSVSGLTSGYQLLLNHTSGSSTLVHSDAVTAFPDLADWNGSNGNAAPGTTLSFRVSTSTANFNGTWWGTGTPLYAGIPLSMTTIMSCPGCNSGMSTTSVAYRILAPGTQKNGAYNGTSTFTALTIP